MAKTRADDCSGYGPEQQEAEPFFGSALMLVDARFDFVADKETHHEGEAIPT